MYDLHSLILTESEKKSVCETIKILHAISNSFSHKEYVNVHNGEVSDLTRIGDAITLLCSVADGFTDCTDEDAICEWFNTPKEYNNFVKSRADLYANEVQNGLLAEKKQKHEEWVEIDEDDCDFFGITLDLK